LRCPALGQGTRRSALWAGCPLELLRDAHPRARWELGRGLMGPDLPSSASSQSPLQMACLTRMSIASFDRISSIACREDVSTVIPDPQSIRGLSVLSSISPLIIDSGVRARHLAGACTHTSRRTSGTSTNQERCRIARSSSASSPFGASTSRKASHAVTSADLNLGRLPDFKPGSSPGLYAPLSEQAHPEAAPARTLISSVARGQPKPAPASSSSAMSPDRKAQQPLVALPMLRVYASPKLARTPMESGADSPQIAAVHDNLPRRVLADNFDGPASHSASKPGHARMASVSTGAGGTRGYVSSSRQAGVPQPRTEVRQTPTPATAQAIDSASTGLPPLSTSGLPSAQAPLSSPILPPVVQKMFGAYDARDLEDAQQQ